MKHLLLIAAFVFAAAPAFAQNNSDVDQSGDDNVADVVQSGANSSVIDQDAIGAGAFVDQSDAGNTSSITQLEDPFNGNGSIGAVDEDPEAFVNQSGDDNSSTILQQIFGGFNQVADVDQTNGDNVSDIEQTGNGPGFTGTYQAFVTQTGDATSNILQEGTESAKNFRATVVQDASFSDIDQVGIGQDSRWLEAQVNQSGGSTSFITQDIDADGVNPGGFPDDLILADVDQQNGATSTITQNVNGDGSSNMSAVVTQNGVSSSTVTQTYNNELSNNFSAMVNQSGDDHSSTITQVDDLPVNGGDSGLSAEVNQSGENNDSDVYQENRIQSAIVTQTGTNGLSDVDQSGVRNNYTLTQSGDLNESYADQRGNGTAVVDQTGDENDSFVDQFGSFAKQANVTQAGVGGTATVLQQNDAKFDVATIEQGAGATDAQATITQNGDMVNMSPENNTDNEATILQNLTDAGVGNIAEITQTGVMNTALTVQDNGGNMSDVMQNGSGNSSNVVQN